VYTTTVLFTRIRTELLFSVLKKYINFDIAERRKTFYLDLRENFPKARTVFQLIFIYKSIYIYNFVESAFRTNGYVIYTGRAAGFSPFSRSSYASYIRVKSVENIARRLALYILVAIVACLYHHRRTLARCRCASNSVQL